MQAVIGGFTSDVMTLIRMSGKDKAREILREVDGDELPEFIRDGIIESLKPSAQKLPAFAQQLLGRALVEHVDWGAVAAWMMTDAEAN